MNKTFQTLEGLEYDYLEPLSKVDERLISNALEQYEELTIVTDDSGIKVYNEVGIYIADLKKLIEGVGF